MTQHNIASEWGVMGSLLIDIEYALPIVSKILTADDFEDPVSRAAFQIFLEADGPLDWIILQSKLIDMGLGSEVVDMSVREWLTTPSARNVEVYAEKVKEQSNVRKLTAVAKEIEANGILNDDLRAKLDAIEATPANDVKTSEDLCMELFDHFNSVCENPDIALCRSGYPQFDKVLGGGFQKSGLYIIGARPGMGKTTLALNIADKVAKRNEAVLFVSMEMSTKQIMAKRLAINSHLQYAQIMNGTVSESVFKANFLPGMDELMKRPFYCCDSSALTVAEIARRAKGVPDLKMIIVDYLGLIHAADETKKLYEQVTEISRDLKALAKRMNIPVLALCQVNRQSVQGMNKKPSLADLRDSGSIEQDADGVIMLYREDYFNNEQETEETSLKPDTIQLIIAKNRHGEGNATIDMIWNGLTGQITEFDYKH